jgi:hypothetical protein
MTKGSTIKVQAVSKHGKNRIREHGNRWFVLKAVDHCACRGNRKALLVVPAIWPKDTNGWWRWVAVHQDKDFEIIETLDLARGDFR